MTGREDPYNVSGVATNIATSVLRRLPVAIYWYMCFGGMDGEEVMKHLVCRLHYVSGFRCLRRERVLVSHLRHNGKAESRQHHLVKVVYRWNRGEMTSTCMYI
jgi:hypothetical protein